MISIALERKTIEVSSINAAYDSEEGLHQIWATIKGTESLAKPRSLKIAESKNENDIAEIQAMINVAIDMGECLVDLTKKVK